MTKGKIEPISFIVPRKVNLTSNFFVCVLVELLLDEKNEFY